MRDEYSENNSKSEMKWPWSDNKIPIIAFTVTPYPVKMFMINKSDKNPQEVIRLADLIAQYLNECGFTAAITGDDYKVLRPMCDALQKYNIGFIPHSALLHTIANCNGLIQEFKDKSNWVANLIFDEPGYWNWGDFKKGGDHSWDQLITSFQMLRYLGLAKGKHTLPFFNLGAPFGIVECHELFEKGKECECSDTNKDECADASKNPDNIFVTPDDWTGSFCNYHKYLDTLEMLLQPEIWCYDLYPIRRTTPENPIKCKYKAFYTYMREFSNRSRNSQSQFWAFAMCTEHTRYANNKPSTTLPTPTIGYLRFEVMNALAYGAQGILYYAFGRERTKKENADGYEEKNPDANSTGTFYKTAPIETCPVNGDDTTINLYKNEGLFNMVKQVNSEIRALDSIFWGCEVKEVSHTGHYIEDAKEYEYPGTQFKSDNLIVSLETESIGVVVSYIQNGEDQYVVIVNHDPFNAQYITVILSWSYYHLLIYTSPTVDSKSSEIVAPVIPSLSGPGPSIGDDIVLPDKVYRLTLEAGGIAIFSYKKK